ncbi:MAG: choice-of-anchor Q domain-containing protein, partial [Panacagrimonas sp.]
MKLHTPVATAILKVTRVESVGATRMLDFAEQKSSSSRPIPLIASGPPLNPIAAALALGLFGMHTGPASAATLTVTTTAQTSVVACTLSDAIRAANTDTAVGSCPAGAAGLDTLVLPARSVFSITTPEGGTYNGLPVFTSEIVIQGNGSTIRRDPAAPTAFRIVAVGSGSKLTLQSTTISGGVAEFAEGGGIHVGGGGTLALVDSTVSGNGANYGAGIYNSGTVTLTRSTLSGNGASDFGGGLYNAGTATLTDSTVSGNGAFYGGGLHNKNTLTLTHSTVSGNNASHGGGLTNLSGTTTLSKSLIAGNTGSSGREVKRLSGTVTASNLNLFGHSGLTNAQAFYGFNPGATDITATSNGNTPTTLTSILNTTLAFNGGPTQTHALVTGSPALDAYPPDGGGACVVATDQRGFARPRFGDCDIGAFEFALLELGDAPASYGTLLADNGPVHAYPASPGLGFSKDNESDGQPSAAADGDDSTNTDDEQGVTTPLSFTLGQNGISLPVSTNGSGFLSAWLDINGDGDFDDAIDVLTLDAPLNSGFMLTFNLPANASAGTSYLRLRVCTELGSCNTPRGVAKDGEVEDFVVTLLPRPSFLLGVTKDGTGAGTVTSTPAGIDCGSDCSESLAENTSVTLTANPASGSAFAGFSANCAPVSGMLEKCTVSVDAAKTVTATFNTTIPIGNIVQNAGFETGSLFPWYFFTAGNALGSAAVVSDVKFEGARSARVTITRADVAAPWNATLGQPLNLVAGATYTLKFRARADRNLPIRVNLQRNVAP